MVTDANKKKVFLSRLLLKLYHEGKTGVVTVTNNRRRLMIYLKNGHVVYAEGIDTDSQLLKEIASKNKLDRNQLDVLNDMKEREPHSLGRILLERNIISKSAWKKFLDSKVKYTLGAAFQMDTADLEFNRNELDIPPEILIDYNIVQLLLDTIRRMNELEHFERYIPGDDATFAFSRKAKEYKAIFPLSPHEQSVLSEIDGRKTVGEIMKALDLDREDTYRILYLLLCFDMVAPVHEGGKGEEIRVDFVEIINLYLDLLRIIEGKFRKEVGKEFDEIFETYKNELPDPSKELFRNLTVSEGHVEGMVEEISTQVATHGSLTEAKLFLLSSFNKLIYMLLMKMKKVLGDSLSERTLEEMVNVVQYVEKYRQEADIMDYLRANLEDYRTRLSS
jgi:hypothetical protein